MTVRIRIDVASMLSLPVRGGIMVYQFYFFLNERERKE